MAHAHFMNLALAMKYGTNESLFLTNLCFWIEKNKANRSHYHEGRYWVYNTMEAWCELFPYFTKDQIRHLIEKMKQKNILLVGTYNKTRYDRTQWYSVHDEVMDLYLRGSPISPGGHMEVGKVPDASAPEGRCMWDKSHIEVGDLPDRSGKSPTPIPYNKHIYKPDAAGSEKNQNDNEAATAASANEKTEKIKTDLKSIDSRLVFTEEFYSLAHAYLEKEKLSGKYLAWLYRECSERKTKNLRGLYYSLFFKDDILALFREQRKEPVVKKKISITCPVCGNVHDEEKPVCPECGIHKDDALNETTVKKHKKFYLLSPEDKAAYEKERRAVLDLFLEKAMSNSAMKEKWLEIDKKYHILE